MKMRDVVLYTDLHKHPDDDAEKAAQLRHKRILQFRLERDHLLVRLTAWASAAARSLRRRLHALVSPFDDLWIPE
jgi:hypothetical protein